jgi:hypothetical protein
VAQEDGPAVAVVDFLHYSPTHQFIFRPTRELWTAPSVDARLGPQLDERGKWVKASTWLARFQSVEQMVWDPSEPPIISDKVLQVGGYAVHPGAALFNEYRPAEFHAGDSWKAGPWSDHLRKVYPADAQHIERYLAFKVQNPGKKINHGLVVGGAQGIGKDTILVPIKTALGIWNWQDISPGALVGRFNGFAKCVMLLISEARDLGEMDRYKFYEHTKGYLAAPPDVIRVDEKNRREHYVANVCGCVITTNYKTDGLYLPADDRRHYVAWSDATREMFDSDYWTRLYAWYADGGIGHVIAYLLAYDLGDFDAKRPPPKTPAFWAVVQASEAPEAGELRDVIEHLGQPAALTLWQLIDAATELCMQGLCDELKDRRSRRAMPHKLERVGYVQVRNPDADDGLFKVLQRRQVVYARKPLSLSDQIEAGRQQARRSV